MNDALRAQLVAIVSTSGIGRDDVVHPANTAQLQAVLDQCAAAGIGAAPSGTVTTTDTVLIGAERLGDVRVAAPQLLVHTGASCTWAMLRRKVAAKKLAVSGLPSTRSDHVGESIARGEVGHRTLAGVLLLTGAGELIAAGGRTLKDVVGYDIAGLVLGSGTRLGLIVEVTLRLEPAAAKTPAEPGAGPWRGGDGGVDIAAAFAHASPSPQVVSPTSE